MKQPTKSELFVRYPGKANDQKPPKGCYHFSIDDVFDAFIEVSDRGIPFFDHPFFRFLKNLNAQFGTHVHLYLYYQKRINRRLRTLKEVSGSLKDIFFENPWIHAGPHGLDNITPPHIQPPDDQIRVFESIYQELHRFAGYNAMSKWVRLHQFSESYELAEYFKNKGVEALLSTDKNSVSYRMPEKERGMLKNDGFVYYKGIKFIRSQFRIENLLDKYRLTENFGKRIDSFLVKPGWLVIMTHEYELKRPEIRDATSSVFRKLLERSLTSL